MFYFLISVSPKIKIMDATVSKVDVTKYLVSADSKQIVYTFNCSDGPIYCPAFLAKSFFSLKANKVLIEEFAEHMSLDLPFINSKTMKFIMIYITKRTSDEFMEKNIELDWKILTIADSIVAIQTLLYLCTSMQTIIYFVEDLFNSLDITFNGFTYFLEEKEIIKRKYDENGKKIGGEVDDGDEDDDSDSKAAEKYEYDPNDVDSSEDDVGSNSNVNSRTKAMLDRINSIKKANINNIKSINRLIGNADDDSEKEEKDGEAAEDDAEMEKDDGGAAIVADDGEAASEEVILYTKHSIYCLQHYEEAQEMYKDLEIIAENSLYNLEFMKMYEDEFLSLLNTKKQIIHKIMCKNLLKLCPLLRILRRSDDDYDKMIKKQIMQNKEILKEFLEKQVKCPKEQIAQAVQWYLSMLENSWS